MTQDERRARYRIIAIILGLIWFAMVAALPTHAHAGQVATEVDLKW